MRLKRHAAASLPVIALLIAGSALAVTPPAVKKPTIPQQQTVQTPPAGINNGASIVQNQTGVGSNNDAGLTTGVKQTGNNVDLQGGYQGTTNTSATFGVNAGVNGKTASNSNSNSMYGAPTGFQGASVGGIGSNGGNGDLNLNNGGMAGVMDDTNGTSKINPNGGNNKATDDHGNPMTPDGNYNYGGEGTYAATDGWGGHPHDGQDSHGNTWKDGNLYNGYDSNGCLWKNGKPWEGKDGNGGSYHNGNHLAGTNNSEPGPDMGQSDGPGGTSATGALINIGNRGGNDGGQPTNNGTGGGATSNATGQTINVGNIAGGDAGLPDPKPPEAMNTSKLNNGVTDPVTTGGMTVH